MSFPHATARTGRELFEATKPFARESRLRSWWVVGSTLGLMVVLLITAALLTWWPLKLACSILGGLVMVRAFIIYHDYLHGTILQKSPLARVLMYGVGTMVLTPPRAWRESHNYHHAHVGQIDSDEAEVPSVHTDIGAFPLMTVQKWQQSNWLERLKYRISRHPLVICAAYVTVFMGGICLGSVFAKPSKHWPGILVFLAHFTILALLWLAGGWSTMVLCYVLPLWIAATSGAYLFYAQHSFPEAQVYTPDEWNVFDASLHNASYFQFGRVMEWFTGAIGYHHVHHLNSRIPFYRLREAMEAIPELQAPVVTRLRLHDINQCFKVNLWDPVKNCMVSYRDAKVAA